MTTMSREGLQLISKVKFRSWSSDGSKRCQCKRTKSPLKRKHKPIRLRAETLGLAESTFGKIFERGNVQLSWPPTRDLKRITAGFFSRGRKGKEEERMSLSKAPFPLSGAVWYEHIICVSTVQRVPNNCAVLYLFWSPFRWGTKRPKGSQEGGASHTVCWLQAGTKAVLNCYHRTVNISVLYIF